MGARGNSGVILSQLLRGLAEVLGPAAGDGPALARALDRASDLSYEAVATPVEGTVLTVARGAAAVRAEHGEDGERYLQTLARYAREGWPGIETV